MLLRLVTTFYTYPEHTPTRAAGGTARYTWNILFSGYAPEYVYERGRLDTFLPFAELQQLSHINARAQATGDAPDFSQRIRAGLPMPLSASRCARGNGVQKG